MASTLFQASHGAEFRSAVRLGNLDRIKELLAGGVAVDTQDLSGKTALMEAASEGLPETMEILLNHGARVNLTDGNGNTALHWAVTTTDLPVNACISLLVEAGAQVEAKNIIGFTPFALCVKSATVYFGFHLDAGDYADSLALLLEMGADPEIPINGQRTSDVLRQNPHLLGDDHEKVMAIIDRLILSNGQDGPVQSKPLRRI